MLIKEQLSFLLDRGDEFIGDEQQGLFVLFCFTLGGEIRLSF